jgi:alpha-ketoglutaric semialdehyde dehydrogenase
MTSSTVMSRSPQRPDDIVIEVESTTPDAVSRAAAVAKETARGWARRPAAERAAALDAAAAALADARDELTALVVREVGKPLDEARGEIARGISILRYYAQQVFDPIGETHAPSVPGLLFTDRRPHGVVGLITPWNFPVAIPLWKAAPALAFGNGVLLKPAPAATAVALRMAEVIGAALPSGLLQVVPGGGETGTALIDASDAVSFTGSAAVGAQVAAAATRNGIPVQAEMGGQNAVVVFDDADPQKTAIQILNGAFGYAGQKCTATRRIIVVGEAKEFVDAFTDASRALQPADPAQPGTIVGPVINQTAQGAVVEAATQATRDGGHVIAGGAAPYDDGWYVAPTVIGGLAPDHPLCQEEVFGPICTLHHVDTVEEAVRVVNSVRYGLVTGVHTKDLDRALTVIDGVDTGMVKVNAPTAGVDFYLPFGGAKDSSYGMREQGKAARDFYTFTRTVTIASTR